MRYLITGTAGFIGFHLAKRLLKAGHDVVGIDGMTPYYDVKLKEARNQDLERFPSFKFCRCLLEDAEQIEAIVHQSIPDRIVHVAAQAGVRYSLENPRAYIASNIVGTFNLLEACRARHPSHLLIASTSSVYGASRNFPLAETANADHPLTLYAASKKSVEAMAHCYAHLWRVPTTIFRFFSVYGPWGRPDMAVFKFVQNILAGRPIEVYNHGKMERDFTYVDDLVEAVIRLCDLPPSEAAQPPIVDSDSSSEAAPYRIVNIGGRQPVSLLHLIEEIERVVGRKAERHYMDMQSGDVPRTEASTEYIEALIGYRPATPIAVGIQEFVRWYRDYYRL